MSGQVCWAGGLVRFRRTRRAEWVVSTVIAASVVMGGMLGLVALRDLGLRDAGQVDQRERELRRRVDHLESRIGGLESLLQMDQINRKEVSPGQNR